MKNLKDKFKIKLAGIGDCGIQIITNLDNKPFDRLHLLDIEKLDMNTEWAFKTANKFVKLGARLTRGLGSGAIAEIGEKAAEEDKNSVVEGMKDCNLLIIVAGLGGGTGSGASPVVAEIAKELKISTIAFVTMPLDLEGKIRHKNAEYGLEKLKSVVDVLIVLSNEKFLTHDLNHRRAIGEHYKKVEQILQRNILKVLELFDLELANNKTTQEIFKMLECDKNPRMEFFKAKQN